MKPFITYREDNEAGNLLFYILQRAFPHYEAVISLNPKEGALGQSPVPGYHLYVVILGTLRGNMIPGYKDVADEMQAVANQMAEWYFINRIQPDEKKYKKWKIISHVPSADK